MVGFTLAAQGITYGLVHNRLSGLLPHVVHSVGQCCLVNHSSAVNLLSARQVKPRNSQLLHLTSKQYETTW